MKPKLLNHSVADIFLYSLTHDVSRFLSYPFSGPFFFVAASSSEKRQFPTLSNRKMSTSRNSTRHLEFNIHCGIPKAWWNNLPWRFLRRLSRPQDTCPRDETQGYRNKTLSYTNRRSDRDSNPGLLNQQPETLLTRQSNIKYLCT